jgi:Tfp pilus assembly protein PilN
MATPSADLGMPLLNKKALMTVGGITLGVWVTALATGNVWVIGLVAVLTVALVGLLLWALNMAKKQKEVMALLQKAQGSPEARKAALEELAARDPKGADAMGAIARAQLEAQENPDKALETLAGIDMSKLPQDAADQVRAFRCQLLLFKNRARDARDLADQIQVPSTGPMAQRVMMSAVVAEAWARTGKANEAMVLLEDFKVDDPEIGEMKPMLLFARVFTHFAVGRKERCKKDMAALMAQDINLLGRFVQPGPGIHIELRQIAAEVLQSHPEARKMARAQQPGIQHRGR